MQTTGTLCALLSLLFSAHAEVVERFKDVPECLENFYQEKVPELGASTAGVVRLCQRFRNNYHFATLYDTIHRIPVYSAYILKEINGKGRDSKWFVEPQLVNMTWQAEMMQGSQLEKDHSGDYQGENQALDEDYIGLYKAIGFNRGHLNPNGHHADDSRKATFTLTNVVPQNADLNGGAWATNEKNLQKLLTECSKVFVLVGAVPSADNWIVKNNVNRVNIPDYLWNAYCCVDNNDKPVQSGAATAKNTENNLVEKISLDELETILKNDYNETVKLFDNNCKPNNKRKHGAG